MPKHVPLRQCLACREKRPKRELVRVVRTPQGEVCLDRSGKVSGRGAYLCTRPECFKKAKKSRALDRALEMSVPEQLYDRLAAELASLPPPPEEVDGDG
jgi:predicted RNA-binding protein YlxR (DUF448 family)